MDDAVPAVKHLIACGRVSVARAGWDSPSTLHDVLYWIDVPGDREWPVLLDELWLFVRFYGWSGSAWFGLTVVRLDPPGGGEEVLTYFEIPVVFPDDEPVHNRAWNVSAVRYPGPGRYVFRLTGEDDDLLADEYILLRRES